MLQRTLLLPVEHYDVWRPFIIPKGWTRRPPEWSNNAVIRGTNAGDGGDAWHLWFLGQTLFYFATIFTIQWRRDYVPSVSHRNDNCDKNLNYSTESSVFLFVAILSNRKKCDIRFDQLILMQNSIAGKINIFSKSINIISQRVNSLLTKKYLVLQTISQFIFRDVRPWMHLIHVEALKFLEDYGYRDSR